MRIAINPNKSLFMKKVVILFIVSFCFVTLFAQHISFVGIQLGQSEQVVDRMLRQKGFQYVGVNNVMQTKMYNGTFWKFQDTRLNTEVEDGRVTAITLCPAYDRYNQMSDFTYLVSSLDKKYGNHKAISSFFKASDLAGNDGYYWKTSGGYIVSYYAYNSITGKILISIDYLDRTNKRIVLESGRKRNTDDDL